MALCSIPFSRKNIIFPRLTAKNSDRQKGGASVIALHEVVYFVLLDCIVGHYFIIFAVKLLYCENSVDKYVTRFVV